MLSLSPLTLPTTHQSLTTLIKNFSACSYMTLFLCNFVGLNKTTFVDKTTFYYSIEKTMPISKQYNYSLREHNTFGIDAIAQQFITYDTVDELIAILNEIRDKGQRILHIGSGSNLLFTKDFDGVVLHSNIKFIQFLTSLAKWEQLRFKTSEPMVWR